ncbi:CG11379 [Drosophila busckii]|uniref:CG11379 n=1 Tax=Drosophila busckii TaxID=30019 RepID=A0A0M3QZ06_DROBS|nr:uncharacterized protein LOC108606074 [Drosophila busckii]ALC48593.1 CG11379 [Drosophila busckii]
MERLSISALGMAIVLHSVLGISYYSLLARDAAAPLLGSWLFIACIGALLQAVHILPQWCRNCSTSYRLAMETAVCCLTLDLLLTKLWCRIESLCHCAIVGVLQLMVSEERTFRACEYWLLGASTSLIGACLLWFMLWATALPSKLQLLLANLQLSVKRCFSRSLRQLVFGSSAAQLEVVAEKSQISIAS